MLVATRPQRSRKREQRAEVPVERRRREQHAHPTIIPGIPGRALPFMKAMATYRELLARVKEEIDEVGAAEARERQGEALFVDVREREEWEEGIVPGAVHIPRGNLESRIEGLVPDRSREIVVYCAGGSRSAFAAKALQELGYENVTSLTGGFTDWKRNGFPVETPRSLSPDQRRALLAPPADPGGRRGRPGAAARRAACS